jgi:threonine synthase
MRSAQEALARSGLWQELSCAAEVAALIIRGSTPPDGPVVCVLTSSGFKGAETPHRVPEEIAPTWSAVEGRLREHGII